MHGATPPETAQPRGAPEVLNGRCLCGAIAVTVRGRAGPMVLCHCSQCRKTAGAPFLSVLPVAAADVEITDSAGALREYRATPGKARAFCGCCGSPVLSRRYGAPTLRLRAGLFAHAASLSPSAHIFAASAAPWDGTCGRAGRETLPCHPGVEPGRGAQLATPPDGA